MDTRLRGYDDLGAYALFGWRTILARKLVGWLWRQAGAHLRLPQSWLTIMVLTPTEVACQYLEPRARRPGATDARRASLGGRVRPGTLRASINIQKISLWPLLYMGL